LTHLLLNLLTDDGLEVMPTVYALSASFSALEKNDGTVILIKSPDFIDECTAAEVAGEPVNSAMSLTLPLTTTKC